MSKQLFLLYAISILFAPVCYAQTNNEIFKKMVGAEVVMDTAINVQFLQGKANQRFTVDSDNDGRIDVIYFIDNDPKHLGKCAPLLVKIVDEDGDMYLTGEGDLDSDLYIADWYGDGTIDRVVDYVDLDGDNDVDEQYLYQWISEKYSYFTPKTYGGKSYCVAYTRDYGDDNCLWYHSNYEYSQRLTEWLTDFNGDEMFVYPFYFDFKAGTLTPACEMAFSFYDLDGDSLSEEAVRFEGAKLVAESLRYSMDIDNDARAGNRHDYDFSITSLGPINLPSESCKILNIRGIKAEPVIDWQYMRQFAKSQAWGKTHLTWDEDDNNIDPEPGSIYNERWEGVLNLGNEFMPQVGGPACSAYNKRNEIDIDGSGRFQFYYSRVDRRFHIFGAEVGWIKVDYNYDNRLDMVIWMNDKNKDGFFDTWKYDIDADGVVEREVRMTEKAINLLPLDYAILHQAYLPTLKNALKDNQQLIETTKALLQKYEKNFILDPVEKYFSTEIIKYGIEYHLGEKIKNSLEGTRYYGDIIRERYWIRLCSLSFVTSNESFPRIQHAYETGNYLHVADLLSKTYF